MPFFLNVPGGEGWDEEKCEFVYSEPKTLELEHSLKAVAAWEAIHKKPFVGQKIDGNEFYDYILCMITKGSATRNDLVFLSQSDVNQIMEYINDQATATKITEKQMREAQRRAAAKNKGKHGSGNVSRAKDIVTAEIIYYWMIEAGIPFSCDTWNLNRLMTLIQVVNLKEAGGTTMPKKEMMSQNAQLNAARRAAMNSSG